jgi:peptidyl-dipeptidase Dcp
MPQDPDLAALLQPWPGALQTPPFDTVRTAALEPAFELAFAQQLQEVQQISAATQVPTFDNTIAALERSGRPLARLMNLFGALTGTMADQALQDVERRLSPRFASHSDSISLQPGLFARIEQIAASAAHSGLSAEQQRVVERYHIQFIRRGARLQDDAKARLTQINQQLATHYTHFTQNLLADEERHYLLLHSSSDLAGLPAALVDAAAAEAIRRGAPGKWVIPNTRSAVEPFLACAQRRDLRESAWRMWVGRCDGGDKHDNKQPITSILALRAERARLLGFATHADYQLADTMAGTPAAGLNLIRAMWEPAVQAAESDRRDFQALIASSGEQFELEPWDWRFYAEKTRKARYDVDEAQIKPYLGLEQMQAAAFWVAGELFGLTLKPLSGVPVYHPDVSVFSVHDHDGTRIGLFYFDPFARPGKSSGAWMNELRTAEHFDTRAEPVVVNVCNFSRPPAGQSALLGLDDVITLFHEFGHALHGLLSKTAYPLVAGTNVSRDFVEFPSQIYEHWATRPEVLGRFARHVDSGEVMPHALMERVLRARRFNQGFATVEFLASAWVDMDLHLSVEPQIDISAFEQASLARLGMPAQIVMRHRPTQFAHIFGGDGYSASYYAYLWSQVLDHDGFAAFEETRNVFDPAIAARLRSEVLERGNSRDPAQSYRAFRGREPRIDALLRNRGFAGSGEA